MGKLIVFEGCDRSGKSTAIATVKAALMERQKKVFSIHYPGHPFELFLKTAFINSDRIELLKSGSTPGNVSVQVGYIAKHIDLLERYVIPALIGNDYVLMDRFWWSTFVQLRRDCNYATTMKMLSPELFYWDNVLPEPTVFYVTRGFEGCAERSSYNEVYVNQQLRIHQLHNDSTLDDFKAIVEGTVLGVIR